MNNIKQHVLTEEEPYTLINKLMVAEFNFSFNRPTVVAMTEDLILLGTTHGELWMYDSETQAHYHTF